MTNISLKFEIKNATDNEIILQNEIFNLIKLLAQLDGEYLIKPSGHFYFQSHQIDNEVLQQWDPSNMIFEDFDCSSLLQGALKKKILKVEINFFILFWIDCFV